MGVKQWLTAVSACAIAAGAVACGSSTAGSSAGHAGSPASAKHAALDAPVIAQPARRAPDFALRNSVGRTVRLSQFRGKAVLLTFIYDHCPDTCPVIVGSLHAALQQMPAAQRSKVEMLAVSVDPRGDTPTTVKRFLTAHDMTGRMDYLIGSEHQLAPVWRAYGIQVQGNPDQREVSHSALVYGITGRGSEKALYPANFKPAWIAHDVPLLSVQ